VNRSAVLFLVLLLVGAPRSGLVAQGNIRSSITLSAITITFPTVTEADYDAGAVSATAPITVTFDSRKNGGGQGATQRTSTISIRATSATLGGSKPISDLQWQANGTAPGGWTGLSTSNATVESRPYVFNGLNDPWSVTVYFRTLMSWANDPPATYAAATVQFTLTITTP
jgi:hypothetical protein